MVNKVDRPGARPDWVVNQTFDLFDKLGATDEQLDFPVVYASALNGWATLDVNSRSRPSSSDMRPLFEAILEHVPAPAGDVDGAAAVADLRARLLELRRPHRHRPHPPRQHRRRARKWRS